MDSSSTPCDRSLDKAGDGIAGDDGAGDDIAWDDVAWDAVIIGAGAAGLYTALCLPAEWNVLLLTKEALKLSASGWAQGGIAAAIAPGDSPDLHIADTLEAGAGLCERQAVEFLVQHASDCIASLVDLGVAFDRTDGMLAMTREAAHSRPRVLHAADRTGKAVVTTLVEQVLQRQNIRVCSRVFVLQLWLEAGRWCGVGVMQGDRLNWVRSTRVILATGGGGQVFAQTTNPELSTGDGVALAHQAGAQLRDLEFFQFHPTALMIPGAPCFLISEAVRGEGAHLVDDAGDRFTLHYHPDGELAPRDVVSQAIFQHLQKTGRDQVWLDLRPIPAAQVRHRFPNIIRVCQKWGVDLFAGPIPVAPAAHYWMGGVVTDNAGQTTVPGLYAVGETASTGVHGANRLASNSLLECIVFGRQLGRGEDGMLEAVAIDRAAPEAESSAPNGVPEPLVLPSPNASHLAQLRRSLADVLWAGAGICRDAAGMEQAIAQLEALRSEFDLLPLSQSLKRLQPGESRRFVREAVREPDASGLDAPLPEVAFPDRFSDIRTWGELANLLKIGELILCSALFREESRGGHYRLDFPQPDPAWQRHTLVEGKRQFRSEPIDSEASPEPRN